MDLEFPQVPGMQSLESLRECGGSGCSIEPLAAGENLEADSVRCRRTSRPERIQRRYIEIRIDLYSTVSA